MPATLTEALDNLYTSTWQDMKAEATDNVFDMTPFWAWMKAKNRLKTQEGGRWIGMPIIYDDTDNIFWMSKGGSTPLNDYEFMTTAKFDWRYLAASMVRFGIDDQQNRGKNQILSMMDARLTNTKETLATTMETTLAAGSGAATRAFDGLQWLVADDPTSASNTVGGLDPSAGNYTVWRNKTKNMTGISFASLGVDWMRNMHNNVSNSRALDKPDLLLTDQTTYERYEDQVLTPYRITDNKMGDLGFENIQFKGTTMMYSPSISQRMYFLNTKYLYFMYDPMMFFDMTEWKAIPNQINDRAAQIITAGQLVTNKRKVQGVMYNLDTA